MACAKMKISLQLKFETLLAAVEREFPPNGVRSGDVFIMNSILRSAVSSCPLAEEVTDVYR